MHIHSIKNYGKSGRRKLNKYQEALDSLYDEDTFDKNVWGFVHDGDNLSSNVVENTRKFYKDTLQELVDKATKKKPIKDEVQDIRYITKYICPNCGGKFTGIVSQCCYHCGQALDWSEEE